MINITVANFADGSRVTRTNAVYQYDYGQILKFSGLELPSVYEVHFSNQEILGTSKTAIGTEDGVVIPDEYLLSGEKVYAWIFLHVDNTDGETEYKIIIPVNKRAKPTDTEPTPVQQDVITQTIALLQDETGRASTSADRAEDAAVRAEEAAASIDEEMIEKAVSDYLDDHPITVTEQDPTVPSWAKQPNKPTYTAQEVGAVSTSGLPDAIDTALAQAKASGEFDGAPGEDGYSPSASVSKSGNKSTITITDKSGTTTAQVLDGTNGQSGQDGYSPSASVSKSGTVTTFTVTDKTGTTTAQINDGLPGTPGQDGRTPVKGVDYFDGQDGQPGEDGYSPSASVSKSGNTATISITDKNGTTTAQISDGTPGTPGSPGNDGDDGITPDVTVTSITGGHNVAFDYGTGDSRNTDFDVMDGVKGDTGEAGDSGVYIGTTAPSDPDVNVWIDTSGAGDVITVSGTNPVINGVANTRYLCGEVSTISITPPQSGIIDVIFTSGSSVALLTVPNTVKWSGDFNPLSLETNTIYELNILDGTYGAVITWT